MTESHPPHPTDEALSAAIDGHDEDGAAAHADGCERCQYRMEAMRGVASVLAVPPPIDELERERAIAQAVRVRPEPAGSRRWGVVLGAAAAVLVAALLVPLLLARGGGDSDKASHLVGADGATESMGEVASGAGSLGSFDDPNALRAALAPLLGESFDTQAAGDSSERAAAPTTTMVPPAGALSSSEGLKSTAGGGGTAACVGQVQQDYGSRVGALLYSAGLTWSGQSSVVLVYAFKEPQGSLDKLALVLRQSDCQLLTSVSL